MHVPDQNGELRPVRFGSLRLARVLGRLRVGLEYDHSEWRDILQLGEDEYRSFRESKIDLPITALENVAEYLELSIEELYHGRVDIPTLAAHVKGDREVIPEKYLVAANSSRRSVLSTLDYVELSRGGLVRAQVLRRFQLKEAMFSDLNAPVNVRLGSDMAAWLSRRGMAEAEFVRIGTLAVRAHRHSGLHRALTGLSRSRSVYERVFDEHIVHIEKNCRYRILKMDDQRCVVESKTWNQVADALGVREVGSREICAHRLGFMSATPGLLGFRFGVVREPRCVHRGDPACLFEIEYAS